MGVLGSGKTTVGSLLAQQLRWQFVDGDSFHPQANIDKMRRGMPLTDADREPWLNSLRQTILHSISENRNLVLACSALKRVYRERLLVSPKVKLVYLRGSFDLIQSRVHDRRGHFAAGQLLATQFADLEEPAEAIVVGVNLSPIEMVQTIIRGLEPLAGPDIAS